VHVFICHNTKYHKRSYTCATFLGYTVIEKGGIFHLKGRAKISILKVEIYTFFWGERIPPTLKVEKSIIRMLLYTPKRVEKYTYSTYTGGNLPTLDSTFWGDFLWVGRYNRPLNGLEGGIFPPAILIWGGIAGTKLSLCIPYNYTLIYRQNQMLLIQYANSCSTILSLVIAY
jgi:hypothetical protein